MFTYRLTLKTHHRHLLHEPVQAAPACAICPQMTCQFADIQTVGIMHLRIANPPLSAHAIECDYLAAVLATTQRLWVSNPHKNTQVWQASATLHDATPAW